MAEEEKKKELKYKCPKCNKEYTEAEATELMKSCCGEDLTQVEIAYRKSPSPSGP